MNYEDKTREELIRDLKELQDKYNSLKYSYESCSAEDDRVKKSLQIIEERQRFILQSLPVAIYSSPVNPNIDANWISGDVMRITGYEVEEYLSKNDFWRKRIHPDDKDRVLEAFKNLPYTKELMVEYRWLCRDCQYHWFQDHSVYLENQETGEFLGVIIDISERRQFEEELVLAKEQIEKSEQRLQNIIQSQAEGISFVNQNEVFEFANKAAETIFETLEGELTGASLYDFLEPIEKENINRQSVNRKNNITSTYEVKIVTKKANVKYLQVSATPKFSETGEYLGAYGVFRDISAQKQAEQALLLQNGYISKLNHFSIELAGLPAHENLDAFISRKIKEFSGAVGVIYSEYDAEKKVLNPRHIELEHGLMQKVLGLLNKQINSINSPVNDEVYQMITSTIIKIYGTLSEASFGAISKPVGLLIKKVLLAHRFIGVAFLVEGNLYGTALLAMAQNQPDPPIEMLENFAFLTAVSLRRKQAEVALRESEENYKVITQSVLDGVFIIDRKGSLLFLNQSVERIFGFKVEEHVGNPFMQYVPKNQIPRYFNALKEAFLHKEVSNLITQVYHKNGLIIDVEINGKIAKLNGKTVGIGTIRDITERKQFDIALKLAKESYLDIFNSVSEAIYVLDESGTFIDVNKGAEKMYRCSREDLIGKTPYDLAATGKNDLDKVNHIITTVTKNGEPVQFDFWAVRKNGEVFPKEVIVNRGKYFEKNVLILTARDITEKKQSEELLKLKNEELVRANADKDKFLSILAHDLKSPFNSILGFLNLLSSNIRDYDIDKIEYQIQIINKAANKFYNMLEDILLWVRSQSGKIPFQPQKHNLKEICKDTILEMKLIADSKNIALSEHVSQQLYVLADGDMLKTILRNLLSNAVKFTNPGGEVTFSAELKNDFVVISVKDSGVGIPKKITEKLFRIDENISTAGTQNEIGTGLGLILCKEFVEKHNGKIWAESEELKGSTFCFSIPSENGISNI